MDAARHVIERRVHFTDGPARGGERWQVRERLPDVFEELARELRLLEHEHVEMRRRVAQPIQKGAQAERVPLVRVALANVDEASKGAEEGERGVEVAAGERVEHHVDAPRDADASRVARRLAHAGGVRLGVARVVRASDAELHEQMALLGGRGRRVDDAALAQAEVDGREPNAARRRVDEHPLASADARAADEREPCGRVRHRARDRHGGSERGRRTPHPSRIDDEVRSEAVGRCADDGVSRRDARHGAARTEDDAVALAAEPERVARDRRGYEPLGDERVAKVERPERDAHVHLVRSERRRSIRQREAHDAGVDKGGVCVLGRRARPRRRRQLDERLLEASAGGVGEERARVERARAEHGGGRIARRGHVHERRRALRGVADTRER